MKPLGFKLRTTEGKLQLFILVCGLLVFIGVISIGINKITTNPQFCSLCHEMQPEHVTWSSSAHNTISCTSCHIPPGTVNLVKHKGTLILRTYKSITKTYLTPIELSEPIKNEVCIQCHSNYRRVTPGGDIIFPHQKHVTEKLLCVDCHSGVVHGNIGKKGFTTATDYTTWTLGVGRAYMKPQFTRTTMEICMECHEVKDIPVTCNTCHKELIEPATHKNSAWLQQHGIEARENYLACDKCHSKTGTWVNYTSDSSVRGYIQKNTFCLECHAKNKPPGHTVDWRNTHGPKANSNKEGCLACHQENRIPESAKGLVPKSSCANCHGQPVHQGLKEYNKHPFPLNGEAISNKCIVCHPADRCGKCHYIGPPNN
ncbi:MAG: NapC/NirT family cytochrome c [Clostridia bacterium]|nr:NapC/NirT family cytochrome c [Clostridia bacterium]